MVPRRVVVPLATLLLALTACAPTPAPTPTPTGFTSEEEAFAAAEETYRAYNEATNGIHLDDPKTFEPIYEVTTENELSSQKENLTGMHAQHWKVSGQTTYSSFRGITFSSAKQRVVANVCVDVSEVNVTDIAGKSVVSADRPNKQAVEVTFAPSATSTTGLAVALATRIESTSCVD